ncbi:hypothetical protein [Cetobacterium sp.]|uniref:hypothetical protein n=1 Tax=Cetobacterium sp. TaxID=2071632 RepID=UPI003F2E2E73
MNRFDLIRGALSKLSLPFDESNYFSDTIIKLAEEEFDKIMTTAFTGTNLSLNVTVATLNQSVEKQITYNDKVYTPYMLPEDFMFLVDGTTEDIFIGRNRIYRVGEGTYTIKYTRLNTIEKLNPICYKYLEYLLAAELAPAVNKRSLQKEFLEYAMYQKDLLNKSEVKSNVDVFGAFASQSGVV